MDNLDLSMFFNTKGQAADFAARLATVSEQIYSTTFNLEKTLMDQFGMQKKDKLLTLLRENNIPVNSQTTLREFFAKLQEHVTKLPILSLTIAFEPKESTLKAISEWLILNFKKQMVLDIVYDPSLLAGAAISYNGRHGNYSIKPKFDEITKNILYPKPPTPVQSAPIPHAAAPLQVHPAPVSHPAKPALQEHPATNEQPIHSQTMSETPPVRVPHAVQTPNQTVQHPADQISLGR